MLLSTWSNYANWCHIQILPLHLQSAREHQTSSVPFPFTGVGDFEASIRMPIGETFVPRTSFKKLTKPKVKVAKGAVIDPVDKSELVKRGIVKFNDMQEIDVDCGMF